MDQSRRLSLQIAVLSATALFLELMVIRWAPAVVRIVNYYANLMLISSFAGLGIGALLAARRWDLFRAFPLFLLADVLVLRACREVLLPGSEAEARFIQGSPALANYAVLVAIFACNTLLFVPLGQKIGRLFAALPNLRAYGWDLAGSLAGTLLFGAFAFYRFSPVVGMAAVVIVTAALAARRDRLWHLLAGAAAVVLVVYATERHATWSPYHFITVHDEDGEVVTEPAPGLVTMMDPPSYTLRVNQDFFQLHGTIDRTRYQTGSWRWKRAMALGPQYLLPYVARRHPHRVLIVGAGGGTDAEAALLGGAGRVDAVEIDPGIVRLSRRFNASRVYDDPRVHVVVDDARAFLQRARGRYDVVAYGFLDSQGLSSSMSNIRLDGFVYTVEGLRAAWRLVDEGGLLSVAFYPAGRPWLVEKLAALAADATGRAPVVYSEGTRVIVLVPRGGGALPSSVGNFHRVPVPAATVPVPTDDWPYLYLRARTIPADYLVVILSLLALSIGALWVVKPPGFGARHLHFACLGAGFLLLETRSIVACALYFGSTWLVILIVVCGVLLMVAAANAVAMRRHFRPRLLYAPLLVSLFVLYAVPPEAILGLPLAGRLLWTLLVVPLPIFFAGLVFSRTFDGQPEAPSLLGANLIGAMAGGFGEYLGMLVGHRALLLLVVACYLASYLFLRRTGDA